MSQEHGVLRQFAEAHVRSSAPTWMHLFQWESPVLPHLRAAHGIDGSFDFGNTEAMVFDTPIRVEADPLSADRQLREKVTPLV